jgi:hypothetical protein
MLHLYDLALSHGKGREQGNVTSLSATRHQQSTTDNTSERLEAVVWISNFFYTSSRALVPKPRTKDPRLDPDPIPKAAKCEIISSNCYKCGVTG